MARLSLLILLSTSLFSSAFAFSLFPGIGGGISVEPKANASTGVGLNLNPNWNLTTNIGQGIAVGSLANGTKAIGQSAVNGAADTLNATVNGGSVGAGAGISAIIDPIVKAIFEVTL